MKAHAATATVKNVAVLSHVREVALIGAADLVFWKDRLAVGALSPTDFDGQARVMICAIESRFLGVRFREICVSVFAHRDQGGAMQEGLFFAVAFNSSRLFAASERAFFSTPYRQGRIRLGVGLPASITLFEGPDVSLRLAMAADASASPREPLRVGDDGWEGPVFLPGDGRGAGASGKWFLAKICGQTRVYPFLPAGDEVTIGPALGWLTESGFSGREWSIREDATHARTKTFGKRDLP